MAYNPSLYNPYGTQQFQPTNTQNMNWSYQPTVTQVQPINGLSFIDNIEEINTLKMPPGSVSQPYFLKDENKFIVVKFDNMGGSTKELFSFTQEPITNNNSNEFVTREYFDQQMNNIMEAINGKHSVSEQPTEKQ